MHRIPPLIEDGGADQRIERIPRSEPDERDAFAPFRGVARCMDRNGRVRAEHLRIDGGPCLLCGHELILEEL